MERQSRSDLPVRGLARRDSCQEVFETRVAPERVEQGVDDEKGQDPPGAFLERRFKTLERLFGFAQRHVD